MEEKFGQKMEKWQESRASSQASIVHTTSTESFSQITMSSTSTSYETHTSWEGLEVYAARFNSIDSESSSDFSELYSEWEIESEAESEIESEEESEEDVEPSLELYPEGPSPFDGRKNCVLTDDSMTEKDIQTLVKYLQKKNVLILHQCCVRIHCIDHDVWRGRGNLPKFITDPMQHQNVSKSLPSRDQAVESSKAIENMCRDLQNICSWTGGLVLTWSGMTQRMIHKVLKELSEKHKKHIENFVTVATKKWTALSSELLGEFTVEEGVQQKQKTFSGDEKIKQFKEGLDKNVSTYASNFLFIDTEETTNVTKFQQRLIKTIKKHVEDNHSDKHYKMPDICVLFNGGQDSLRVIAFALKAKIPVIVVKGSGGLADMIAEAYSQSEPQRVKKRRKKSGEVKTVVQRKLGNKHFEESEVLGSGLNFGLLNQVLNKVHHFTIYWPEETPQNLYSCIFEALLKNGQEKDFNEYLQVIHFSKKVQKKESQTSSKPAPKELTAKSTSSNTKKKENQEFVEKKMDLFIEALKQNCDYVVDMFMKEDIAIHKKFTTHLHMGRILHLYGKEACHIDVISSQGQTPTDTTVQQTSEVDMEKNPLIESREKLEKQLKITAKFPLNCGGKKCLNCGLKGIITVDELKIRWTCLHPVQELFLWSLKEGVGSIAAIFWRKCDDKIAAALFAHKVFKSAAEESEEPQSKWQLSKTADYFQSLAIETLKCCQQMDEVLTEQVLTKPCPWWGYVTVMELAILTDNSDFIAQMACKKLLTLIWRGQAMFNPDKNDPKRSCGCVDKGRIKRLIEKCPPFLRAAPVLKYAFTFVTQVLFLALFSVSLLNSAEQQPTPIFVIVIVWVGTITLEELRQFFSEVSGSATNKLSLKGFRNKISAYQKRNWNTMDFITIILFWLGMLMFAPCEEMQIIGKVLLSIDIFFFFMRIFQMLMVFDDLGLMVVMVYKMFKDTRNFMIILLVFVLGYSVATESILYPENPFSWERAFQLPRKGYWQMFGNLFLEEIENRGDGSCKPVNESKYHGYDSPPCPTESGSYIVPFFLGLYLVITNVLLLNLLIARFGKTFEKVYDAAQVYQSWHRCLIINEYYSRKSIPPPFNVFYIVYKLARELMRKAYSRFRSCSSCLSRFCVKKDRIQKKNKKEETKRSADGRSIHITWTPSLTSSEVRRESGGKEEHYIIATIEVSHKALTMTEASQQTGENKKQFKVQVCAGKLNSFSIWDLDSNKTYTVKISEGLKTETAIVEDTTSILTKEQLIKIKLFEEAQAKFAKEELENESPEEQMDNKFKEQRKEFQKQKKKIQKLRDFCEEKMKELKILLEQIPPKNVFRPPKT